MGERARARLAETNPASVTAWDESRAEWRRRHPRRNASRRPRPNYAKSAGGCNHASFRGWFGNGQTFFAQAFNVKIDGFADQRFALLARFSSTYAAGKIRHVS